MFTCHHGNKPGHTGRSGRCKQCIDIGVAVPWAEAIGRDNKMEPARIRMTKPSPIIWVVFNSKLFFLLFKSKPPNYLRDSAASNRKLRYVYCIYSFHSGIPYLMPFGWGALRQATRDNIFFISPEYEIPLIGMGPALFSYPELRRYHNLQIRHAYRPLPGLIFRRQGH